MAIPRDAAQLRLSLQEEDAPGLAPTQLHGRGHARRAAPDDHHVEVGAAQASASRKAAAGRPVSRAASDTSRPRQ